MLKNVWKWDKCLSRFRHYSELGRSVNGHSLYSQKYFRRCHWHGAALVEVVAFEVGLVPAAVAVVAGQV